MTPWRIDLNVLYRARGRHRTEFPQTNVVFRGFPAHALEVHAPLLGIAFESMVNALSLIGCWSESPRGSRSQDAPALKHLD